MKNLKYSFLLLLIIGFVACDPQEDDKTEFGALPNPTFEITQGESPNKFILENTTPDAFLTHWDLGVAGCFTSEDPKDRIAKIDVPEQGEYQITMTSFNQGGSADAVKTLIATQDDPLLCNDNLRLLAGTSQKTWKLANEDNALHVGPGVYEYWWGNDAGVIAERACLWNDEFIFKMNFEYEYDDKGDFWADSDDSGGVIPSDLGVEVGCHPATDLAAQYQSWGPGIHKFSTTENTITLTGEGAWMGLYKVATNAEVTTPQESVTYKIDKITADTLIVYTTFPAGGDTGHWRFTFVSE